MRYSQIREMDISNGEGIGIALFTQGCDFHCKNCFNSGTWDFNSGKKWTNEIQDSFLNLLNEPYIKRCSILGGEPLTNQNLHELLNLILKIKEKFPTKTIWLYTGYTWEENFLDKYWNVKLELDKYDYKDHGTFESDDMLRRLIISQCDVLVDGRYIDSQRDITLKWRGSKNQRVINVQESLKKEKIVLWTD